jgi:hypothetical protein
MSMRTRTLLLLLSLTGGAALSACVPQDGYYGGGYYGEGYYGGCNPYDCPGSGYALYYGGAYYDGLWYDDPLYYRDFGGSRQYWIRGGWHRDEWRGARPEGHRGRDPSYYQGRGGRPDFHQGRDFRNDGRNDGPRGGRGDGPRGGPPPQDRGNRDGGPGLRGGDGGGRSFNGGGGGRRAFGGERASAPPPPSSSPPPSGNSGGGGSRGDRGPRGQQPR